MMTIQEAEDVAKKLYRLEQKRRQTVELFDDAMERVKVELYDLTEQQKAAIEPINSEIDYLKSQLEVFQVQRLEETGEKTVRLPHATLKARKLPQTFVRNDDALLEWAEKNATEMIKTIRSVAWNELKKELELVNGKTVYKPTGEILEAVTIKPEEIKYSVEVVG